MENPIVEEPSLLDLMRLSRMKSESVFVKFVNNSQYHGTHAFCFYEGEDGKYYDPRIRTKFEDKFITYVVGNKKEVLKLLKKINEEGIYNRVCMMFFVDRDFDDSHWGDDENLFETPCYSIENLYSGEECFKKIIQSEFYINTCDSDYSKCLADFNSRLNEFNNVLLEFNALALYRRKQSASNSNFAFGNIKTSHLVDININNITKKETYDEVINNIKSTLSVTDECLAPIKTFLETQGEFNTNFRGKNQLDFLIAIIRNLKDLNKKHNYFCTEKSCIHINITSNRLSELSQYAATPERLTEFLQEHLNKLIS